MVLSYELIVDGGSPLIGMKLEDLVRKYNIDIFHVHNPCLHPDTRMPYEGNITIKEYFSIKIGGLEENIRQLVLES